MDQQTAAGIAAIFTATKRGKGKPRSFETEEEFQDVFSQYLYSCMQYDQIPNVAGFCVFADIHRQTFYDCEKHYPDSWQKAKDCLEDRTLNVKNTAMGIFLLKNQFGYSDRPEYSSDSTIETIDSDELDQRILKGSAALMIENVEKSTD